MLEAAIKPPTAAHDGELLADFLEHRREESFAALVHRHGGMVIAVCRSVLRNQSDAEDAAQAVFLTLAHRAGSLTNRSTLSGWLHRVAWHVAARAAEARANRRRHEQEAARMKNEAIAFETEIPREQLHAALERLPEKYRLPILLHHLQGRSEEETARILGCSVAAASVRLTRGRKMLRDKLIQQGATVSLESVVAIMAVEASSASAAISPVLASGIAHSAAAIAAGNAAMASASILSLSKETLRLFFWTKLKLAALAGVAFLVIAIGGTAAFRALAQETVATQPAAQPASQPDMGIPIAAAPPATTPDLVAGSYTVTNLGTLGGRTSAANAINSAGDIVGVSDIARAGIKHAFLYHDGKMLDLGTLGGDNSQAIGINDAGQIVGQADVDPSTAANAGQPKGREIFHAFLFDNGKMQDLGTLGGAISSARAINASGQITGDSNVDPLALTSIADPPNHVILYANGTMQDMGGSGGEGMSINNAGSIAGGSLFLIRDGFGVRQGMIISDGKMRKLNLPEGHVSTATAINATDRIVGEYKTVAAASRSGDTPPWHAFSYVDGEMTDLGTLGGANSSARGINAAGEIVGDSEAAHKIEHAIIYHNGKMLDLNVLAGPDALKAAEFKHLLRAFGINNRGQIVGIAVDVHNGQDAFLLTPKAP